MAYLICIHEMGYGEEGISYAKLLRASILYRPPTEFITNYNYRTEGSTLETFCRWWNERRWGDYDVVIEAKQKTDWDLEKAQLFYKNIRYGPAYGLTQPHVIEGFQACPFENNHIGPNPNPYGNTILNLATIVEFQHGLYYIMFSTDNALAYTRNEPNPATISHESEHTHTEVNGCHYFDGLLVVNKTYPMTQQAVSRVSGIKPEVQMAYNRMEAAWKAYALLHHINKEPMSIASGYRSYESQQYTYNNYPAYDRDTYSARPGHSEHHSGYALDITKASSDPNDGYEALYSNQAQWLAQNCYKFGFIIRYPKNKQNITGYKYEPWHIRYVGTEWAERLKDTTIEEYFGIDSRY